MSVHLSVNVNKVALLRNSRDHGLPSVLTAARSALLAGAQGITIHPRPDERHIRSSDAQEIAQLLRQWPDRQLNIEGNPLHNLMPLIEALRPKQATFVPDSLTQSTSDHGWRLPEQSVLLRPLIAQCREWGVRVSLFMDPDAAAMPLVRDLGAQRVELYTESWARAYGSADAPAVLGQFVEAAHAAREVGLAVNAGHDLNLENLRAFVQALAPIAEVSIGHAWVGDALEMGYAGATAAYLEQLDFSA